MTQKKLKDSVVRYENGSVVVISDAATGHDLTTWKGPLPNRKKPPRSKTSQAKRLKELGLGVTDLKLLDFGDGHLKSAGFSERQINGASRSAASFRKKGVRAAELKDKGYIAIDLRKGGYRVKEMVEAGFSVEQLVEAGYSSCQLGLTSAQFTAVEASFGYLDDL
jgi:hypothetical protein